MRWLITLCLTACVSQLAYAVEVPVKSKAKHRRHKAATVSPVSAFPGDAVEPNTTTPPGRADVSSPPVDANQLAPAAASHRNQADSWGAPAEQTDDPGHVQPARRLTLAASVGNYSLVAWGIIAGFDFNRGLSADVGVGYSIDRAFRLGLRARYQFLRDDLFTPFIGLGTYLNPQDNDSAGWHSGLFLAPLAGGVMRNPDGAFALLGLGYSFRIAGTQDSDDHGFSWEGAAGYAF